MSLFRLTPAAKSSLKGIGLYTQQQCGEKQQEIYLKSLDKCFQMLAKTPQRGKPRPEIHHALRSYMQEKHVIYYIVHEDHIAIVNVLHGRMDSEANLKKFMSKSKLT